VRAPLKLGFETAELRHEVGAIYHNLEQILNVVKPLRPEDAKISARVAAAFSK
jgi:hypothetical protein